MSDRPHILVIDNDPELCKSIELLFSRLNVEIIMAPDGLVAMNLLSERHFDIILLEIMSPYVNFSEIIDYIQRSNLESFIVLMSRHLPEETIKHCVGRNVYGLLQKPFDLTQLLTIVQNAFRQQMDRQLSRNQNEWDPTDRGPRGDRRHLWKDRRLIKDPWYCGPERRSGRDRRTREHNMRPCIVADRLSHLATDLNIVKRTYGRLFEKFWPRRTSLVQEKRQHARVNVGWPLTIKGFSGTIRGRMKNVSAGGAFICAANSLKRGEMFSVRIDKRAVSDRGMALLAKVVRSGIHCLDDIKYPYGIAVQFVRVSDDDRRLLGSFISQQLEEFATGGEIGFIEEPREGEDDMTEEKESMELIVNPNSYPVMKVRWREPGAGDIFQATTPLNREVWLKLATECRSRAGAMDASQKLISCLSLFADMIMSEISSEDRRERNREAYNLFADFIADINSRTDLDKTRKAQMVHDRAHQLKID
jgi:CheY-like chemotaxis protein